MMKKLYLSLVLSAIAVGNVSAVELQVGSKDGSELGINVINVEIDDQGELNLLLGLDFSKVKLPWNKEIICTPLLANGEENLEFTPFSVAGHNRYIWNRRNGQPTNLMFKGWSKKKGELSSESLMQGPGYQLIPDGESYLKYHLKLSYPYSDWMAQSTIAVEILEIGCADCPNSKQYLEYPLVAIDFRPSNFITDFILVTPVAEEVKIRELSGRAYVDFQVNKTNIIPTFRNNAIELAKITATIDSVKNDKDTTVTSILISGTASPEGSYENNVYLAKTRTQSLKDYVDKLYDFPKDLIKTSYEPVDWSGLRNWLQNNQIDNKEAILEIVNSNLESYARNQKIKEDFPVQYQWLLNNVYPSLRHSDYVITYNVRNYTDIDEIIHVMTTSPQNLSLNELFLVANSQPQGSDLYNVSFELAAKMYPEDEIANLNAGTLAIMQGNFNAAEKYLAKAGNSDEARYTRAEYEAINGDKEKALKEFKDLATHAKSEKVREKSMAAVESLEASMKKSNRNFVVLD